MQFISLTFFISEFSDIKYYTAAVLMDLSKAFDCLPHDILLDKLSFYDVSSHSVSLLKSYLTNRKQHIQISSILSGWVTSIYLIAEMPFYINYLYVIQNLTGSQCLCSTILPRFHKINFIQISSILSGWVDIQKGVPQGSILGKVRYITMLMIIHYLSVVLILIS
jgi:hypothetical protein